MKVLLRTLCGCQQVVDIPKTRDTRVWRIPIKSSAMAFAHLMEVDATAPLYEERIFKYEGEYSKELGLPILKERSSNK